MLFLLEIKRNQLNALKTFVTCLLFIGLGAFAAIIGPTILDLQLLVQTTFSQIAYVISGKSIGYITGSIVSKYREHISINLISTTLLLLTLLLLYYSTFYFQFAFN